MADLAKRQHGVVARAQLLALGYGKGAIKHRQQCGRLHPIHRGVYAVGHTVLSREGHYMAAVLASGPRSVLSHRAAGAHWGMRPSERPCIEVTSSTERSRPRIKIYQSPLPPDEITTHRNIPVTTVPRTILDLASVIRRRDIERAINEVERLRLFDPLSLDAIVARHPRRPGTPAIRALLADNRIGATVTREELEHRFITFLDERRLPRPETNVVLEVAGRTYEVDCLWQKQRLIVELDGRATHGTQAAFEADRERDRALQVAGWRVIRVTWRQLHRNADLIASDLQALLFDAPPQRP